MADTNDPKPVLFLFDACMPRLVNCRSDGSCESDEGYFCIHRLGFSAKVINCNGNGLVEFVRFSDIQVILFFAYLIMKHQSFKQFGNFVIATKDNRFLIDAEKEWSKMSRPNKTEPWIEFNQRSNFVVLKIKTSTNQRIEIVINVKLIPSKSSGTDKKKDEKAIIGILRSFVVGSVGA